VPQTSRSGQRAIGFTFAIMALAAGGCAPEVIPPTAIGHYLSNAKDLQRIGRVVFVELASDGRHPGIADGMTQSLSQAIMGLRMFHVEVIRRTDPLCQDLRLDSRNAYTLEELAEMRKLLKSDAIVVGRISKFHPYPRMQVGLHLQLIDLKLGRLIWAVDHVWDTTDKQTEARIKAFFRKRMRSGYDPVDWELCLVSPRTFFKFVAYEITKTLKPEKPEKLEKPGPSAARTR